VTRHRWAALLAWSLAWSLAGAARAQESEETSYRAVAVTKPVSVEASGAQRLGEDETTTQHPLGVHDALQARAAGVTTSDVQGNPLQPDVWYRGFVASPLLGMPQGIAVYQNDVRINEPFGDVVLWDLVPEVAVQDVLLLPAGSPEHHGALGGALVLRTKTAWDTDKTQVSALGGSFGRYQVEAESGRVHDELWGVYAAASVFGERGFRDESPSSAQRFHTDLRRRTTRSDLGLQLTLGASDLRGNGPTPVEVLAREGRGALFTYPDESKSSLLMAAADAREELAQDIALEGTGYVRYLGRDTANGDEGEFEPCDTGGLLCDEEGETVESETGEPIPGTMAYDGLYNTTTTSTFGYGARAALRVDRPLASHASRLTFGVTADGADIDYLQRTELGLLTTERSVLPQNIFLSGDEQRTKLAAHNRALGAFAAEHFALLPEVVLSVGARLDVTRIELDDREGTALDGKHTYARVNPSAGVTYAPLRALSLFARYAESNRVPSASELACADPDAPCRLPNAFVADPPLEQVVGRTVELGARGRLGRERDTATLRWALTSFGSRNQNDILFVAGSRIGTGYFRNAGQTQRLGLEADVSARAGIVTLFASYAYLRATFESRLRLPSAAHPDATRGALSVESGDRIPGLPVHTAKAGVGVSPTQRWHVAVSTFAQSHQRLRGDETGQMDPLDGYATLNAETHYELLDGLSVFAKAQNLLDARYETFGVVADPSEVIASATDPRFVTPAPPLGVWFGVTLREP
jgi:iron complex outermembrane recepter protein